MKTVILTVLDKIMPINLGCDGILRQLVALNNSLSPPINTGRFPVVSPTC